MDDNLKKLANDTELEDLKARIEIEEGGKANTRDDDTEGWVDELDILTDEEHAELNEHLRPLHLLLAKVSQILDGEDDLP